MTIQGVALRGVLSDETVQYSGCGASYTSLLLFLFSC